MKNHILAFSVDRNMLHTLEFILEAEQFTVSTASDRMELQELLGRDRSIHLMILDTNNSAGSSLEPHSIPQIRDRLFPVIILTGAPHGRRQRNTAEWKGISWMEKPVDRETLLRTITDLLREKDA